MLGHRALNVDDYLAVLRRRWWLILLPAVLFPIIGDGITYFITPQFVSQTLVIIQQQQVPEDYVKPVVDQDLDSRLASMREQILSRSLIEPIIEKYNLYGNAKLSMDDRVDQTRASIGIKPIHSDVSRSNGLPGFYISFKASDAHTAQLVCEEVTGLFVKQNLLSRTEVVEDTTKFLQTQLADAKNTLDDEDAKLKDFEQKYSGNLPGDETSNVNVLSTLDTQLEAATESIANMESQKSYEEAMLAQQQVQPTTPAGTIAAQTPQAQQAELDRLLADEADLKAHYTEENPDVKAVHRKILDLQHTMAQVAATPPPSATPATPAAPAANRPDPLNVQQLRAQLRALDQAIQSKRKEQDQVQQQVRAFQARVQSTPQIKEEYKGLTRDNQTAQANYDSLLAKINQSKMATDLEKRQQGEQFKVMDPANLPDGPIYPRKIVFLMGGLGFGLGFGLVIVALLEYKDTALRSERDIWAFTQLPTLAVIAWSGEVAAVAKPSMLARLKRLFSRKPPKELLADVTG